VRPPGDATSRLARAGDGSQQGPGRRNLAPVLRATWWALVPCGTVKDEPTVQLLLPPEADRRLFVPPHEPRAVTRVPRALPNHARMPRAMSLAWAARGDPGSSKRHSATTCQPSGSAAPPAVQASVRAPSGAMPRIMEPARYSRGRSRADRSWCAPLPNQQQPGSHGHSSVGGQSQFIRMSSPPFWYRER
jgi:hypothetical protein